MGQLNKEDQAKLHADTMKMIREHGREDDLLIINFMHPDTQKDKPSNRYNPNAN